MNEKEYDFFADKTVEIKKESLKKETERKQKNFKIMKLIASVLIVLSFCIGMKYTYSAFMNSRQESIVNNIKVTKQIWGDLYNETDILLNNYQITHLKVQKKENEYLVDAILKDGTSIERSYPFIQNPKIKGFEGEYDYSLIKIDNSPMISYGISSIFDNYKADKQMTQENFIPELNYLIKRVGLSYLWSKLPEFRKASFSKDELNNYMKNSPSWIKENSSEIEYFLLNQVNLEQSIYRNNKEEFIAMIKMLQTYNSKVDSKEVCSEYKETKQRKDFENKDELLFNTILKTNTTAETNKICQ